MPALKGIAITTGLITGTSGIAGVIAYSAGAFDSKTQITDLIKKENKNVLLTSTSTAEEWADPWKSYQASNKPWGDFATTGNTIPKTFKEKCAKQSKESVYGIDDQIYKDITKYCARDKTIADLLEEQSFGLLDRKGEVAIWQARFDQYKLDSNQLKLKGVNIIQSEKNTEYKKLVDGCEKSLQINTKSEGYQENIPAIKEWCKAK